MILTATLQCVKCNTTWEEKGYELEFLTELEPSRDFARAKLQYFCPECQEWQEEDL